MLRDNMTNVKGLVGCASVACLCVLSACGAEGPSGVTSQTSKAVAGTVTATPTTDLLDGQEITLSLSGFEPNGEFAFTQCRAGTTTIRECLQWSPVPTDASGSSELVVNVRRSFWTGWGRFVSCEAVDSCTLAVGTYEDLTTAHFVQLDFRNVGPIPIPVQKVTVTPSTGLRDLDVVQVYATGFFPFGSLVSVQCPAQWATYEDCERLDGFDIFINPAGDTAWKLRVRQTLHPATGGTFVCDAPGACVMVALQSEMQASTPLSFIEIGAPLRGSVQAPGPVASGQDYPVTGAGWTPNATIQVRTCPADPNRELPCTEFKNVAGNAQGTLSTSAPAPSYLQHMDDPEWVDCALAPGNCVLQVQDARDPQGTRVAVPLTLTSNAVRGSVTVDQQDPILELAPVRLLGSGFSPSQVLNVQLCTAPGFASCQPVEVVGRSNQQGVTTDAGGAFRAYVRFRPTEECYAASKPCALLVNDPRAVTASAVRIPLAFTSAETIQVTSRYEPEYESLLQEGVRLSGWTAPELQLEGGVRLLWILGLAGQSSSTHLSRSGTYSHTTTYSATLYRYWAEQAVRFDYTVDEFQKTGALFWSWYLAGMPPLPTPS
ncbi:MAG TPA: neocarzinostatin apoprotein domain-containing protein [Polyangiaceae bacterium]|nr:neocarzinostatin apoprotein domain-containing protein [Polyangiaceae bacterium]